MDNWLQEFRAFEVSGGLPQLAIIPLSNDHTAGTRAGALTPRAMVTDNDVALVAGAFSSPPHRAPWTPTMNHEIGN